MHRRQFMPGRAVRLAASKQVEHQAYAGARDQGMVSRRRALRRVAGALLGGLALAGCAPASLLPRRGRGPGAPASPLRVAVPTNPGQGVPALWQRIVATAGSGAGVALQAVPTPWAQSTPAPSGTPTYDLGLGLSAALAGGGRPPDLLVLNGITVAALAQDQLVVALDDLIAADHQFRPADFLPGMLELGRWQGRQVAFPIGEAPTALGYQPAALQRAGVAPPAEAQDRSQFAAMLAKLAQAGEPGVQPTIWTCRQFLLADEVPVVNPDGRSSGLGGAAALRSLTALDTLRAAARPAKPPPPGLAATTITLASMSLGNGFSRASPYRFAEPPRGTAQATRLAPAEAATQLGQAADTALRAELTAPWPAAPSPVGRVPGESPGVVGCCWSARRQLSAGAEARSGCEPGQLVHRREEAVDCGSHLARAGHDRDVAGPVDDPQLALRHQVGEILHRTRRHQHVRRAANQERREAQFGQAARKLAGMGGADAPEPLGGLGAGAQQDVESPAADVLDVRFRRAAFDEPTHAGAMVGARPGRRAATGSGGRRPGRA